MLNTNCKHTSTRTMKWVESDGTLMIYKKCLQCNMTLEKGHVYGEDDGNWAGVVVEHLPNTSCSGRFATWLSKQLSKLGLRR